MTSSEPAPLRGCHLDAIRRRVDGARESDCPTTAEEDREALLAEVDRLAGLSNARAIEHARSCPAVTVEGPRERYVEAAIEWALMYPLANWPWPGRTLAGDDAERLDTIARDIAAAWGCDIADRMLAVRDAELETAREERDAARLVSQGRTMEQYDAEAAIERVRALRGRSSMGHVNDYVTIAEVRAALDGGA